MTDHVSSVMIPALSLFDISISAIFNLTLTTVAEKRQNISEIFKEEEEEGKKKKNQFTFCLWRAQCDKYLEYPHCCSLHLHMGSGFQNFLDCTCPFSQATGSGKVGVTWLVEWSGDRSTNQVIPGLGTKIFFWYYNTKMPLGLLRI